LVFASGTGSAGLGRSAWFETGSPTRRGTEGCPRRPSGEQLATRKQLATGEYSASGKYSASGNYGEPARRIGRPNIRNDTLEHCHTFAGDQQPDNQHHNPHAWGDHPHLDHHNPFAGHYQPHVHYHDSYAGHDYPYHCHPNVQ
jgi:hypothetical protein